MRSLISSALLFALILFFVTGCSLKKAEPVKPEPVAKVQPPMKKLEYFGSDAVAVNIPPKSLEEEMIEAPSAVGEFQPVLSPEEAATQITQYALLARDGNRSLPLFAHWDTGARSDIEGMSPEFMLSLVEQGHHALVAWEIDPYWASYIPLEYYERSIKRAAELKLPLVLVAGSFALPLLEDDSYAKQKNILIGGALGPKGATKTWQAAGKKWMQSELMQKLQEWYPNPPLVVFLSRSEAPHAGAASAGMGNKAYGDAWFERYRALHTGMKSALRKEWSANTIFVGRNTFANPDMGKSDEWMKLDETYVEGMLSVWPLIFDGASVDFVLGSGEDDTSLDSPHASANSLPFLLDDTKLLNNDFWWEATIGAPTISADAERYRGFAQFDLWLNRPSVLREAAIEHEDNASVMEHFVQLIDSVEMVHKSDILQEFWHNGTLVKNPNVTNPHDKNIPEMYRGELGWYMLDTDAQGVWAFALVKGEEPNREWLVIAQSPEGERSDVGIDIPEYEEIRFDVDKKGSIYTLSENIAESKSRLLRVSTKTADLFVATNGKANAAGTMEDPFGTLEAARDAARSMKEKRVNVWLRGGIYALSKTFELNEQDSRTSVTPLAFRAWADENVTLLGGKVVNNWKEVTDEAILNQLPENARPNVLVAKLNDLGIHDYGWIGYYALELFFNGKPMTIARWPNEKYSQIEGLPEGNKIGEIKLSEKRIQNWTNEKNARAHGFWFYDWYDEDQKITKIKSNSFLLAEPYSKYGYKEQQPFYVYNIFSELDTENEWYLDKDKGLLYFWPERSIDDKNLPMVSLINNIVEINNTNYIEFSGMTFEVARQNGFYIRNTEHFRINQSVIRNIQRHGINMTGSRYGEIINSDVYNIGETGILVWGGERTTLLAGENIVSNNHIYNFGRIKKSYHPGVYISGVGNTIANNNIHDSPHNAILFDGNDNMIEYNEIYNVCKESNDAGAIYTGKDWTMRGNVIRYNYLHDIVGLEEKGANGIYLDDLFSSATIKGNIFQNVKYSVHVGSGRDNIIEENIFIDSGPAIWLDATGLGWRAKFESEMMAKLNTMPYKNELWTKKYPELTDILDKTPLAPEGNIVERNLLIRSDLSMISNEAKDYITLKNNTTKNTQADVSSIINESGFSIPYLKIGKENDKPFN